MSMPSYVDDPRGRLPIPAYALIAATLMSVVLSAIVIRQSHRPAAAPPPAESAPSMGALVR